MSFLEILRLIRAALAIGAPPDIGNESAFRKWVCDILCFLADMAEITASDVDDKLLAKLHSLVDNDQHWSLFYAILLAASEYLRPVDQEGVLAGSADVKALGDEVGLDPATIILIIQTILKVIDWWRSR